MPSQQPPSQTPPTTTPPTPSGPEASTPSTDQGMGNSAAQDQLTAGGQEGGGGVGAQLAPADVPRTEADVLAEARARFGAQIQELESRPKKADERLTPYLDKFAAMKPKSWNDEAQALWKEFLKVYGEISKECGDTSGNDVRTLYDVQFTQMMDEWIAALAASSDTLETQARLAHMYRRTLRELSRDLMQDTNGVAVLRARDMVMHGAPDGPSFDSLVEKNMAKPEISTKDQAYGEIIGSSTKHDKAASEAARGPGATSKPPGQ